MGSGIRFVETETHMVTFSPIRFVVSVSLYVSSSTQTDSKSKSAMFLVHFSSSMYGILKESNFSKSFLLTGIPSLGNT